jgi:lincosamide nucleotidyltransferase A/C/D/E
MVCAEDVISLYTCLTNHGIRVWLTGGWGIDALLGEQTRPHKDLDVIMLLDDVLRMCEILHRDGYRLKKLWSENLWAIDEHGDKIATALVLQDSDGCRLDGHAMRLGDRGDGLPAWEVPEGFLIKSQDLAGEGAVAGFPVRCITPEKQMLLHTGYELPEEQSLDLERLHKKFGIEYPTEETKPRQTGAHPTKSNMTHP